MRFMPSVEATSFSPSTVTAMTTRRSQWCSSKRGSAKASVPSARVPACMRAKPPKRLRAAEPEPSRARAESWGRERWRPAASVAARARAAKPLEEEARPAAVGKSLVERMRAPPSAARVAGPCSSATRSRTRSRRVATRSRLAAGTATPLSSSESSSAPKVRLVRVATGPRVRLRLPAAGRLSRLSRLPQYLTRAMLGWATTEACIRNPSRVGDGQRRGHGRAGRVLLLRRVLSRP